LITGSEMMDRKTLDLLEYGKILDMLARETNTEIGSRMATKALPESVESAGEKQKLAREIAQVLTRTSSPMLFRVKDLRPKIAGARQGLSLTGAEIKDVLDVLEAFLALLSWIGGIEGYPEIAKVGERIPALPSLRDKLASIVDGEGAIKDSASPGLYSIRRSIRELEERLRKRAEELATRGKLAQFLQDPIVTIRNGRYVIPVKQEHGSKVPGIVHDQSASGQTLFIEPQELIEMGNNLRRLRLMERDEIERILSEASSVIGQNGEMIESGLLALGDFDLALAKVRLLHRWNGSFPRLSQEHEIMLVRAWHPLLRGEPVPMDLSLSERGTRTLVITGPNMGGKTVALKTIGLLTAMTLAGLPCPCQEPTVIGKIEGILADIGDQQSIEENLSTFSAHMSNVRKILEDAGPGKLVLIDELGQGTDPEEGAALAVAILKSIHEKGPLTVVTSHFSQMKVLAQDMEGVENASVEWDAVNMVPTYRLTVGKPGRSNAFLVAKRLGIPEEVLEAARSRIPKELVRLDQAVEEMEEASQRARLETRRAEEERNRYARAREQYEEEIRQLEARRKEIVSEARKEAENILSRARVEFEKALREVKAIEREDRGKTVWRIRERLKEARRELLPELAEPQGERRAVPPEEALPGKIVHVAGFSEPGTIVEPPDDDGEVLVQIGPLRLRVDQGDLYFREDGEGDPAREPVKTSLSMEKAKEVSAQVDLRGMTREEAYMTLEKYLDDAFLAGLGEVRIIHGKGTGALRKMVEEYLRGDAAKIAGFRLGAPSEGGAGVTVAKLIRLPPG